MRVKERSFFTQEGCIERVYQLFGNKINVILDELNERLVA